MRRLRGAPGSGVTGAAAVLMLLPAAVASFGAVMLGWWVLA